jgi:hypothetical protein
VPLPGRPPPPGRPRPLPGMDPLDDLDGPRHGGFEVSDHAVRPRVIGHVIGVRRAPPAALTLVTVAPWRGVALAGSHQSIGYATSAR